jgi:hypothetical protein
MPKKPLLTKKEKARRAFSQGYKDGLAGKDPMLISPTDEYCRGYEHGQQLADLRHPTRPEPDGQDRPIFLPLPVVRG